MGKIFLWPGTRHTRKVFLITFITLILLMLSLKDIKKPFLVITSFTILTTEISFFFSFSYLVQKQASKIAQHPNFSIQISQTVNPCPFFATCHRNTYICLLLSDKPCNSQSKGMWLCFCLWHDHKRDTRYRINFPVAV